LSNFNIFVFKISQFVDYFFILFFVLCLLIEVKVVALIHRELLVSLNALLILSLLLILLVFCDRRRIDSYANCIVIEHCLTIGENLSETILSPRIAPRVLNEPSCSTICG